MLICWKILHLTVFLMVIIIITAISPNVRLIVPKEQLIYLNALVFIWLKGKEDSALTLR